MFFIEHVHETIDQESNEQNDFTLLTLYILKTLSVSFIIHGLDRVTHTQTHACPHTQTHTHTHTHGGGHDGPLSLI